MLSLRTAASRAAGVRALSTSAARMGGPKPIDDSTSALDCESPQAQDRERFRKVSTSREQKS